MKIPRAYLVAIIAFLVTWLVSHGRSSPYNNFVLLADALVHGHAWIAWPGAYIDALSYNGQRYVIEAPTPAFLLMPFVAIFGTGVNQTLLAVVLCAVGIGAAWELCDRYGVPSQVNAMLCAFLLAGTDLLWCAMLGDVWFIAHVSSVCFTLLALCELAGKRRGWLVAIWAALAVESRFSLIVALPVYAYLLAGDDWKKRLGGFATALVPFAAFWLWYNNARWGTWYDIGYTAWYHQDSAGLPTGSPFRLQYLGYQLNSFFVQGVQFVPTWPYVQTSIAGLALTYTSPALILALLARRPAKLTIALWVAALLTAAPNFIYYVNGFSQFGMRHALDFEPFLFALMALGLRDRLPAWGYAIVYTLIAYSCVVGLWGCWYWNVFVRTN
ncbi:MAG: hypothetical protein M3R30_00070 [Candidatus Eremiobacteraeota bacterium]|nr:hypothetical protein [Candidatus Eremiobacteraeota bacterium]